MNKKIIGILACVLLITSALPTIGGIAVKKEKNEYIQYDDFTPGEFIVKFTEDISIKSTSIKRLNEKYQVRSTEKVFKNTEDALLANTYRFKVPDDSDILSIINDYSSNPHVEFAEPNGFAYLCGIPNDIDFNNQWSLHNSGQTDGTPDVDIDAPEAWEIDTGNSNIVIAIIDSGVDYTHPDLADNIWINEDEIPDNGIDDDSNFFVDDIMGWDWWNNDNDPLDDMGHGTLIAGIIGAVGNNDIGIAGVCWDCKIMPLKIFNDIGNANNIDIAMAIEYAADNGADVISMSFGSYYNNNAIRTAVLYASLRDVVLVAAVGNHGISRRLYPAALNKVIAVAGTDHNDNIMNFYYESEQEWVTSNYGTWVDVAAPGQNIYTTMPTYPVTYNQVFTQNYTGGVSGTSHSCPHVAGVAALILSIDPTLTRQEVKSLICDNTDPYNSTYYLGTGRVNAFKALPKPDLTITDLTTNTMGRMMMITATIENTGNFEALEPFPITFYAAYEEITPEDTHAPIIKEIGSITISSIAIGDQKEATILWMIDPTAIAIYAVVDNTNTVIESNENNNGAITTI